MLSDNTKQTLEAFVKHCKNHELGPRVLEKVTQNGPVKAIDIMLDRPFFGQAQYGAVLTEDYYEDLKANRQEAEQYLAGLLGLC